jgi:ATP-dependent Lon protease
LTVAAGGVLWPIVVSSEQEIAFECELGGEIIRIPAELPLLPVRNTLVFPHIQVPLSVGRPLSLGAIAGAAQVDRLLAVVPQRRPDVEEPTLSDLYSVGSVVKILRVVESAPGRGIAVDVVGVARFELREVVRTPQMLRARIAELPERFESTPEAEAARRTVQDLARELISLRDDLPDDFIEIEHGDASRLADEIAFASGLSLDQNVALLSEPDVLARLRVLIRHLMHELRIAKVSKRVAQRAAGEIDETHRKKLLRDQLRKIQEELGESSDQGVEEDELRVRIDAADFPDEVRAAAVREVGRMGLIPSHSPERSVIRTYVEWLLDLPWKTTTEDNLDLAHAKQVLDEDHYDLEAVKDRILEYLAVRRLVTDPKGPILCFVGPPGVGKTSLGKSIARAMGRKCVRTSLGGVRDEAEIRGHRRTYVGALPGRIIQSLKTAGARNAVFILDEIDKVGTDYHGDPSSALLEVLDPEQNDTFSDHYLELPFDLSKVLFVATANRTDTIPGPLLDRMELIELPGYTAREKLAIARQFILPRQIEDHGLAADALAVADETLSYVIDHYTREAGVRTLDRQIAALVRKSALKHAEGASLSVLDKEKVVDFLGPPIFTQQLAEATDRPGVSIGLVWTPVGGDLVFVEAALLPGEPRLKLTGQLGDVMRESAETAVSYLRANADRLGIDSERFEKNEIHIHFPAGAMRKEGPSAGVTVLVALASLLSGRPVQNGLAMTGEITLRGQILPVGGIKEKVLAAHRAGIHTVMMPARNQKDLEDVPKEVLDALALRFVSESSEALEAALASRD